MIRIRKRAEYKRINDNARGSKACSFPDLQSMRYKVHFETLVLITVHWLSARVSRRPGIDGKERLTYGLTPALRSIAAVGQTYLTVTTHVRGSRSQKLCRHRRAAAV